MVDMRPLVPKCISSGKVLDAATALHLHGAEPGRIAPRAGGFTRNGAYGVSVYCRAQGVLFANSSDGMVFVRFIECRTASSLLSGRLRRDIMSAMVVGGMGMDTWCRGIC